MRHFDSDGPLLQMRSVEAAPQHASPEARDYLLLTDLVGSAVEFELCAPAPAGEARPGWH